MANDTAVDTRPRFFARTARGQLGLVVFLNAGDPPLDVLPDVIRMLDESYVDCLELAVPFPNSFTDGPVIRRSAARALATGVDLSDVLTCLDKVSGSLNRLRIVLLADWSHTVRPIGLGGFLRLTQESAAEALLVHGLPATLRGDYYQAAARAGVPVVTTCYPTSEPRVLAESARNASAYLYLVRHYGRSGTTPPPDGLSHLVTVIRTLRTYAPTPVAVGFGIRDRADIDVLKRVGADAAVIGSAAVAAVEHAMLERRDVTAALSRFLGDLRPVPALVPGLDHHISETEELYQR